MGAYKISIDSIKCVSHADPNGSDEVWILAQSDGGVPVRYPKAALSAHSMTNGETWDIDGDLTIEFNGCCNFTLYDQDISFLIQETDFLGCARFTSGADASQPKVLSNGYGDDRDHSEYQLYFSWVAQP